MKNPWLSLLVSSLAVVGTPVRGQMHKVAKPQQVVRAVGVYEWTGDMAKPTASRLIPVSLYINGTFEDAGVYLARPVPFALETGNVYELREGRDEGWTDRPGVCATDCRRRMETTIAAGGLAMAASRRRLPRRRARCFGRSKTLPVIVSSGDDSRPHFGKAGGTAAPAAGSKDGGDGCKAGCIERTCG